MHWSSLEEIVAQLYRDTGAEKVVRDIDIGGHQIDVYVEMRFYANLLRIGIECKHHKRPIGINEATPHIMALRELRMSGQIDVAVFVSTSGFTKQTLASFGNANISAYTLKQIESELLSFIDYIRITQKDLFLRPVFGKKWYINHHYVDSDGKRQLMSEFTKSWLDSDSQFLLILGDYGTGKTTFVQKQWLQMAKWCINNDMKQSVPIFLRLREVNECTSLRSFITDVLINQYGIRFRNYHHFTQLLEDGRLIIFLDGFDEMTIHSDHGQTLRDLSSCAELCSGRARVVLTSRPSAFGGEGRAVNYLSRVFGAHQNIDYKIVSLARFSPEDISRYVALRCSDSQEVIDAICGTYNLLDLGARPFLLELMVQELPNLIDSGISVSPATLYESYINHWLERDEWRVLATKAQRLFLMEELATYVMMEGVVSFTIEDIRGIVSHVLGDEYDRSDLRDIESDIRLCSFLDATRRGEYVFSHLSFAEYFVARKLCRNIASSQDKAEFVLNSTELPISVERFAIDIALNVLKISPDIVLRFSFPFNTIDHSLAEAWSSLSERWWEKGLDSSQSTAFSSALLEMYYYSTSLCRFRAKLGFVLLCLVGEPESVTRNLLRFHSKHSHGSVILEIINLAVMSGQTNVPAQVALWYETDGKKKVEKLFFYYVDLVKAYTQREMVSNPFTREKEQPSEKIMRRVEEQLDIPETRKDDFRREVMISIASCSIEGKEFSVDSNESLGRAVKLCSIGFDPFEIWWEDYN